MKLQRAAVSASCILLIIYAVVKFQHDAISQTSNIVYWHATYHGANLNRPTAIFKRPTSGGGYNVGDLFVLDTGHEQVKRFSSGTLYVVAGNGTTGNVNGAPGSAEFSHPMGLDGPGWLQRGDPVNPGQTSIWLQLTVYDTGNNSIRGICIPAVIDGRVPPPCSTGTVITKSTSVNSPSHGIGVASTSGALYFANSGSHQLSLSNGSSVTTIAGSGAPGFVNGSLSSAEFAGPTKIAAGPGSTLFVADAGNYAIRAINTSTSQVSTFAGGGGRGYQNGSASAAKFALPTSAAYSSTDGYLYVADSLNHCIRRIDSSGNVTTYAGTNSPGYVDGSLTQSRFDLPSDLLIDGTTMYIADTNNNAVRVINMTASTVSTYIK